MMGIVVITIEFGYDKAKKKEPNTSKKKSGVAGLVGTPPKHVSDSLA